jgi:general secretion pathway protein D
MSRYILAAFALTLFLPSAPAVAGALDSYAYATLPAMLGQVDSDAARKQVDDLLGRARQSLNEGNLETADSLIGRAEGLNVAYGLFHTGDTPKKARRDLEKAREARGGKPAATDPFAGRTPTTLAAATAPAAGAMPPNAAPAAAAPANSAPNFNAFPAEAATPTIIPLPSTAQSDVRVVGTEPAALPAGPAVANNDPARKQQTLDLVRQARAALAAGGFARADALARQADAMGVPDKDFGPQDDRAWLVLMEIEKLQRRGGVVPAAAQTPLAGAQFPAAQAVYDPATDATRNMTVAAQNVPTLAPTDAAPTVLPVGAPEGEALKALDAGEAALRRRDMNAAQNFFRQAQARINELDPASQQRLQDRLSLVGTGEPIAPGRADGGLLDEAAQAQSLQARQVSSEVARLEQQSRQIQETDPAQAQAVLQQARVVVEKSSLDAGTKELMLRRLDRDLGELQRFVDVNRPKIELSQRNKEVQATLDREQAAKLDGQDKLAQLVEEYNTLIDQQRFAEAEVLAKRAQDIAPNEAITAQLAVQSKALRRMYNAADIAGQKEGAFVDAMQGIDRSGITTENSMTFPNNWADLRGRRGPVNGDSRRRSPKELEIEQRLKTPVSLKFANAPISQVFEKLSAMTGVPIYVDNRGLAAEGIDSSTPVSIDVSTEISLRSALNLILAEHHLTYVIKNEVLKITSDRMRSEEVYPVTYQVGDLIIPIPNFVPTGRMGLAGALADAQASLSYGGATLASHSPISVIAQNTNAGTDPSVLGQMVPFASGGGGPPSSGQQQNIPFGPGGGMGGGVEPDFDSLIELMTSTIEPETWREAGGTQGEVKQHTSTLSLVITQTQAVHEQIEDLLNQLRQLQDLQVTIEVRFIRLSDNFYERIGVDFDMDINSNVDKPFQIFGQKNPAFTPTFSQAGTQVNPGRDYQDRNMSSGDSVTVGLSAPGVFSSDLDIPFTQDSYAVAAGALSAIPSFSATSPGGANVGFAILSDLEAYFFITAVQDDNRSNVLQAPKVTMFNGQQAFVSDTEQRPFVISVIPVVGDFAAAQQPVIVVLNEGTSLSVQAVVSNDRRFVRLTLVPFFSQIGDVNTFTFEGSESTTNNTSSTVTGPGQTSDDTEQQVTRSGTTVQLPTFAFQTVTTTVSVPDGGTVLLGGIKRMTEVRRENGVPLLSKLPYVNRLFENVAIGKSSESLMMMVTPRIIIQSEEEEAIGIAPSP